MERLKMKTIATVWLGVTLAFVPLAAATGATVRVEPDAIIQSGLDGKFITQSSGTSSCMDIAAIASAASVVPGRSVAS
jgi:hypothetical protein